MQRKYFVMLLVIGSLTALSLLGMQIFWVTQAISTSKQQYEQSIMIGLNNMAKNFNNKEVIMPLTLVEKQNTASYKVYVNDMIFINDFERSLLQYLRAQKIYQDIEYGIYKCNEDKMYTCNTLSSNVNIVVSNRDTPVDALNSYAIITFPNTKITSIKGMPLWLLMSGILLLTMAFVGYALFMIFKQRYIFQSQKDFIGNMTHEFKTPITTIGIAQQALADPNIVNQPERLANYAKIIGDETARLNLQMEKILQLSKLENGKFTMDKTPVDLLDIVNRSIENTKLVHPNASLYITNFFTSKTMINCDKIHVQNVLDTVLENGIKYGGKPPQIDVKLQKIDGKRVLISISDNGKGISSGEQNKVFEKFYRTPTGNVHDVKGFGLGLFYAKQVMNAHGFKIEVNQSETLSGACFLLTFNTI